MVLFLHLSEHQEAENNVGWYFFKPHFFFMNFTCFCVSSSKMAPTRQSPQNLSYWLMHLFFLFPFLWFCIEKTQRPTHLAMTDFLKDRMIHRNTILLECQERGNGWELCCVIIFVLSQMNERVMRPGQTPAGVQRPLKCAKDCPEQNHKVLWKECACEKGQSAYALLVNSLIVN